MKYAILGDVHANLNALKTVVEHGKNQKADIFICVGDIVGYGPDPSECIKLLRELEAQVVAGNHDWATLEKIDINSFNPIARKSIEWTKKNIKNEDIAFLNSLPLTLELEHLVVTHGTLHSPERFYYMQSFQDAYQSFEHMSRPLCVCGHSHMPIAFFEENDTITYSQGSEIEIDTNKKTIVNVGSVGQPRDGNPQTLYTLYDTEQHSLLFHRLSYDVHATATKIVDVGLPHFNAERLLSGH